MLFCECVHEITGVVHTDGTDYRWVQVDEQPAVVEQAISADSSILEEVLSGHIVILTIVYRISVSISFLISISVLFGHFNPKFFVLFEG